jgi:hypothetical protein
MAQGARAFHNAMRVRSACESRKETVMRPTPIHRSEGNRRLRAMMALGAGVCVLVLAGVVSLHDAQRLDNMQDRTPVAAADVPANAAPAADFLHAPVTSGNVPAAETAFHDGAPAPEEQPPTF